jgi:hemerythrin-like domain-containing protein
MEQLTLEETTRYQVIDALLDQYNHFMRLYQCTGNRDYLDQAKVFISTLKRHFST